MSSSFGDVICYPINEFQDGEKHLKNASMSQQFSLKEIAFQSGLSIATVDSALHGWAHVSARSARRVQAAKIEFG